MAGSHSGKFTISGTCTAKQFQIRMMGEMPLQFVGEMNCVEYAEMTGKQMDLNSSCTYAGVEIPGQKPMNKSQIPARHLIQMEILFSGDLPGKIH